MTNSQAVVIDSDGLCYSWGTNTFMELLSEPVATLDSVTNIRLILSEKSPAVGKLTLPMADKSRETSPRKRGMIDHARSTSDLSPKKGVARVRFKNAWLANNVSFYMTDSVNHIHQGMYYGGELTSISYPEENSNHVLAKRLIGITSEPKLKRFPSRFQIIGVSLSKHHALAWTTTGTLFSWGHNENGVLGVENNEKNLNKVISEPKPVSIGIGTNPGICFALATETASLVINFRGRIYYWGKYGWVIIDYSISHSWY
jgi:alpha-tubulin suppressor-like RCC1 family protein